MLGEDSLNCDAIRLIFADPTGDLFLELKGKLTDFGTSSKSDRHQPVWREQLTSALVSLGFNAKDSDAAISSVVARLSEDGIDAQTLELSDLLKRALSQGGR